MDEFENQIRGMLHDRVAGSAAEYDAPLPLVARARRRRARKFTAVAASMAVVAVGVVGAVAQSAGNEGPHRVVISTPTSDGSPSVPTQACPRQPENGRGGAGYGLTPPTTDPRVPPAGDPTLLAHFASFALTNDPSYVVLGPDAWLCHADVSDAGFTMVIYPPDNRPNVDFTWPTPDTAAVVVENDTLADPSGLSLACSVFHGSTVAKVAVEAQTAFDLPCDPTGRTVTPAGTKAITFLYPNSDRGSVRLLPPGSAGAVDGRISVLSCRPSTGLISAAECDAIIADYATRLAMSEPTSTTAPSSTPTTAAASGVATVACPIIYGITGATPATPPSTASRVPPGIAPDRLTGHASFAATTDDRYVVLGPDSWSCQTTYATDGDNGMVVYKTGSPPATAPDVFTAPIAILNDYLWHGGVGGGEACSIFDDPAVVQYETQNFPEQLPCPHAGRTVTRVSANEATFVDADGTRGVGLISLPTSSAVDDGKISVLMCRPTDGLTADQCDTIIADYATRLTGLFASH
jgi:hypothetical protein